METFIWCPLVNPQGTITYRTLSAQFGDGYEQRAGDGLNTKQQSWPLSFAGYLNEMQPILDFLDARAGWQRFWWTPPGSLIRGAYRCQQYQMTPSGGRLYQITATFQQVSTA